MSNPDDSGPMGTLVAEPKPELEAFKFPSAQTIVKRNYKRARDETDALRDSILTKINSSRCRPFVHQEYDLDRIGYKNKFKIEQELRNQGWTYETEYKKRTGDTATGKEDQEYAIWRISVSNWIDDPEAKALLQEF